MEPLPDVSVGLDERVEHHAGVPHVDEVARAWPRRTGASRPPCIPIAWPTGAPVSIGRADERRSCASCAIISPLSVRCVWITPFGSDVVPDV